MSPDPSAPRRGDGDRLEVAVPVTTVWASPDAPRQVDAPAVADRPDVAAWCRSMDQPTRRGLLGRTLTQAVLGEPVDVLEQRDGWVRVVCAEQPSSAHPDGYPGWVRRAHLTTPAPPRGSRSAWVLTRCAPMIRAGAGSEELSMGTVLRAEEPEQGLVRVWLPGGGTGQLSEPEVRLDGPADPGTAGQRPGRQALSLARQFLGLRYLWGGTSGWGVDCSGLVHLTFRALGLRLERDAFDQAASDLVEPVPLDEVRSGDLYFFARPGERVYHVGFASRPFRGEGVRWMLHAPEGGELVEDAPMAPHRVDTLVAAGRVSTTGR